jgi:hypothetical protein
MKKLIFIMLILLTVLTLSAQKLQKFKELTITSGGTGTITMTEYNDFILLSGATVTLSNNYTISVSGAPSKGTIVTIQVKASAITYSGGSVIIFGNTLSSIDINSQPQITLLYSGAAWIMRIDRNFYTTKMVTAANIADDVKGNGISVSNGVIGVDADTLTGIHYSGTSPNKKVYIAYDDSSITAYNSGGTSKKLRVKANGIDSTKIKARSVYNGDLASMTRGTVKVGNSTGAPSDLNAKTANAFLIGNGSDIASTLLTGDIGVSSGTVTISNGVVTPTKSSATANKDVVSVYICFETDCQGTTYMYIPYDCELTTVYAYVSSTIAATDNGVINLSYTGGLICNFQITANSAVGTEFMGVIAANSFSAGDKMTIEQTKSTAGGLVNLYLTFTKK